MSKLPLLATLAATAALAMLFRAWDWNATTSPEQLLEEARLLTGTDTPQTGLAQRKLQRALDMEPTKATRLAIIQERAELHLSSRSFEMSLLDFEALLEESPNDIDILTKLATISETVKDSELAVKYIDQILAITPTNSWARAKKAREHDFLADGNEAQIREDLLAYLPQSKLDTLMPMIQQASYLPPEDAVRVGLISRMQADLAARSPESLPIAMKGVTELAEIRSMAREAYAESIEYSINRFNLYGLLSHLRASGRVHDAVDFGLVLPYFPASIEHPGTLQDLALTLESLGRTGMANEIIRNAIAEDATWKKDFLEPWCGILYRAKLWPQLRNAAIQLHRQSGVAIENRPRRTRASFFWGIAAFNLDEFATAEDHLGRFLSIRPEGAPPNALAIAWIAIADINLERGDLEQERLALMKCTAEAPRFSTEVNRRAAYSIRNHLTRGLEAAEYLAHAISMDSSLESELLPLFEKAGEMELVETRVNLVEIAQELRKKDRWYPTGESSTYMLWALAQLHLDQGQLTGALVTYKRLRKTMPGFAPAFHQESMILKAKDRRHDQLMTLLEGMAANGPDPAYILEMKSILADLGGGQLEGDTLRKWMELDPSFAGAIEIAKELQIQDRIPEALYALSGTDRGLFTDSDSILHAEVLTSLNRYEEVLVTTEDIDPQGPMGGTGSLIRARAALLLNQLSLLDQCLTDIETYDPVLNEVLVYEVLGLMNKGGLDEQAMRLARHLATSAKSHSGRNLNMAAATAAIAADTESSRSWVELANAFLTDMSPTAGLLLLNLQEDQYGELPSLARELRAGEPAWRTATHPAILAALEGRLGEARALTLAGLQQTPFHPDWHLLGAALNSIGAVPINANTLGAGLGPSAAAPLKRISGLAKESGLEMIGMLLAKDTPGWSAWTHSRLSRPTYLKLLGPFGRGMLARSTMDSGEFLLAKKMLDQAILKNADFIPYWDLLEELTEREHGQESPQMVKVKQRRRQAGLPIRGGGKASETDLLLDAATLAAASGDSRKALLLSRQAQTIDGESLPVRLAVARLARELDPIAALNGYKGYLGNATGPEVPAAIEEMFELFSMRAAMMPTAEEVRIQRTLLEMLQTKSPHDPLPVIELARLDLLEADAQDNGQGKTPSNQAGAATAELGIQSALGRMERFFRSNPDAPLEELRPGSCEAWFDLLATFDPFAAHQFADQQLDLSPRSIDLWILYARSLEATAQMDLAKEAWLRIGKMTSDPKVALARASLLSELDGNRLQIDTLLDIAANADKSGQYRRRIGFIRGKSFLRLDQESKTKGINVLMAIRNTDSEYLGDVTPQEIDYALAIGLLHRADSGDGARAKELLKPLAEAEPDPLRAQLLTGLAGLGNGIGAERSRREQVKAQEAEEAAEQVVETQDV